MVEQLTEQQAAVQAKLATIIAQAPEINAMVAATLQEEIAELPNMVRSTVRSILHQALGFRESFGRMEVDSSRSTSLVGNVLARTIGQLVEQTLGGMMLAKFKQMSSTQKMHRAICDQFERDFTYQVKRETSRLAEAMAKQTVADGLGDIMEPLLKQLMSRYAIEDPASASSMLVVAEAVTEHAAQHVDPSCVNLTFDDLKRSRRSS